jgi:dimethylaniline monooxygenase (N-oxide forming)
MARQSNLMVSKIGIIGAGVSGIAVAKQLSNYNPVVFEASDSIGGVWKSCSYSSTKLQSPRGDYEFTDFPWPNRDDPSFPSYIEILDYLKSYAEHFDVMKYVMFNTKVVEVRFVGGREPADSGEPGEYGSLLPGLPVWEVAVQSKQSDTIQVLNNVFFFFNSYSSFKTNTAIFFYPINIAQNSIAS